MKHKNKLYVVLSLTILTIAILGFTLWENRIELFVIPKKWKEILKLKAELDESKKKNLPTLSDNATSLAKSIYEFAQLHDIQNLPKTCTFTLAPIKGLDYQSYHCLFYGQDYSAGGGEILYSFNPLSEPLEIYVLNSKGFNTGSPFRTEILNELGFWYIHHPSNVKATVLSLGRFLYFALDSKGITPIGFGEIETVIDPISKQETKRLLPHYIDDVQLPYHWTEDVTPERLKRIIQPSPLSINTALHLLKSKAIGDQHRALFQLELLGPSHAHHAIKLSQSNNDHLRARASLIAARNPSLAKKLIQKLDHDPCLILKDALAQTLVRSKDLDVARRAWIHTLGLDKDQKYQPTLPMKVLASTEVTQAIIERIKRKVINNDYHNISWLYGYLIRMKPSNKNLHSESLHSLWEQLPNIKISRDLKNALSWIIAHLNDKNSLSLTLKNLNENGVISKFTLEALAATQHSIQVLHPTLYEISINKKNPYKAILATIALANRGDRPSIETLQKKLVDPKSTWIDLKISDSFYFSPSEKDWMIMRSKRGKYRFAFEEYFLTTAHPLSFYTPDELIPFLIESAFSNKNNLGKRLYYLLLDVQSSKTRQFIEDKINLWLDSQSTLEVDENLVEFLLAHREEWADEQLLKILKSNASNKKILTIALCDFLHNNEYKPSKEKVNFVSEIAQSSEQEPSSSEKNQQALAIGTLITEDMVAENPPLAASLILARWNIHGETVKLFNRIKEQKKQWIYNDLLIYFSPKSFEPHLEELIKSNPSNFKSGCEYILSWRRVLNWSTP